MREIAVADRFTNEYRVDGDSKVSGQAQYTADFTMPGMLWAAFVSSTVPHARIVSIDTAAAKELPGVHAVLTGNDIGEHYFGRRLCDWPVLSYDRVKFVGEYVVAVAAETPQIAQHAAGLVDIVYDELPGVFDVDAALAGDAPILHEHPEKYTFMFPRPRPKMPHPNVQGHVVTHIGDVDAGMAQADRVFEYTFTTPRHHAAYIEPRATLVWVDGAGVVHVVSTNKSPFGLREQLAVTTGVPQEKIVVHPSFIGGEFGAKGLSVEEFPCYYLAVATGRPVKHVRTYNDDIRSTATRHAAKIRVKTGVRNDGTITAQDVTVVYDGGAYAAGKVIPNILPGGDTKLPYGIPNQRHDRMAVYTNTVPGGFVRAPGEPQTLFGIESSMDLIARELGLDPLEFRYRNAANDGDMDIDGHRFIAPGTRAVIETLRRASRWDEPREPGRGLGVALAARHIGGGSTKLLMEVFADGRIAVRTGTTEVGMGILTVLARVVASELGVDVSRVHAERWGTDAALPDPGVGASRTTNVSGNAALDACRQVREAMAELGLDARDWPAAAAALVQAKGGTYVVTGAFSGDHAPGEPEYNNFAGYVVDVSVDAATGVCRLNDVWFACDAGTIINPLAHRGQIDGGFLMGLGIATCEELILEDGRIQNVSLADYKVPTQRDMPPFHVTVLEEGTGPGPFGARAVGEINVSAVGPALANAVHKACGVRLTELPVTSERVWEALHGG